MAEVYAIAFPLEPRDDVEDVKRLAAIARRHVERRDGVRFGPMRYRTIEQDGVPILVCEADLAGGASSG